VYSYVSPQSTSISKQHPIYSPKHFLLPLPATDCPCLIHSDNGKNFVGADRALNSDFLESTTRIIVGLWEAGVKSFKANFNKAMTMFKYTFEEFATLLCKVEACLNFRPIAPMSEDPTDQLALTPGHFLIGAPLLSGAEPEIKGGAASILNRWQRIKAQSQQFCVRWKREYLSELHKRNKWRFPSKNVEVGDLIVVN